MLYIFKGITINNMLCTLLHKRFMDAYVCRVFIVGLAVFAMVAVALVEVQATHHMNS